MPVTFPTDLRNTADYLQSLAYATYTANANGSAVDLGTDEGPFFALLSVGTVTQANANETYALKLQSNTVSTGGTWADIPGATFSFAYSATASNTTEILNVFSRPARYVRAVLTVSGTAPSFQGEVTVLARKKEGGGTTYSSSVQTVPPGTY